MEIGKMNTLKVKRRSFKGYVLATDGPEVFLPDGEIQGTLKSGEEIEVFVYNNEKDKLWASAKRPYALLGEFACLEVVDVTSFGAFLDLGIRKDLFVPTKHQTRSLNKKDRVIVFLTLNYEKNGIIGSCNLDDYFSYEPQDLVEKQEVELLVYSHSHLGSHVVVNRKYQGLIYKNERYRKTNYGEVVTGYVKTVREDGKIDVSLQPIGFEKAKDPAREKILSRLEKTGGYLALHDKSDSDEIKAELEMSKKLFKKVIGGLYKEGIIVLEEKGIRLKTK
jgi:predicted RNA-binding protein (virulence factor B family)